MLFDERSIEWIPVGKIDVVWSEAQRPLNEAAARQIADNLDPDYFGACVVTLPNGNGIYHCVDGQTRIAAVRMLWGEEERVPCMIVNAEDPARAAAIFDTLNSGRRGVSAIDKYHVRLTAKYEVEMIVERVLKNLGLQIGREDLPGYIRAVSAVVGLYKAHGSNVLHLALAAIKVWGTKPSLFDGNTIRGFGEFFSEHRGHIDLDGFHKALKQVHPEAVLEQARTKREFLGGALAKNISAVLVEIYNKGKKANQRL